MTTLNKKTLLAIAGLMAMAALTALAWAAPNQDFQITSLRPNTVVPGEVLELSGTGADSQGTVQVEVLTNQWYLQDCTARINPDSTWTCGPIHLAGKGPFNNHSVKASLIKDGKIVKSVTVAGIRRQ